MAFNYSNRVFAMSLNMDNIDGFKFQIGQRGIVNNDKIVEHMRGGP